MTGEWQIWRRGFWFRVNGYGLRVSVPASGALFSDRKAGRVFGPVAWRVLRP